MDKKDCLLLRMYGDGEKFIKPVWYPCGNCSNCERDSSRNDYTKSF